MAMTLEAVFWDVQHGHSTYLKSPNGRHIVVDLGVGAYSGKADFSPLLHLKNKYSVKQLDYVIITHPHVDHIDDIFNFNALSPKTLCAPRHLDRKPILESARPDEKKILEKYFEISDSYNQDIGADSPDNTRDPKNWGGLQITVFHPTNSAQSNLNNHSKVALFEYAGMKLLIPGDNEPTSWNELKDVTGFLSATKDVDVLLAPHHGRDSGFDNDTMTNFNPRLTVISDGRFCDTSATSRYSAKTRGWTVHRRKGEDQERKCVTTRNDGVIVVKFGREDNGDRFLEVTID